MKSLYPEGIHTKIFFPHIGKLRTLQDTKLNIHGTLEGKSSVLVDAVIVPEGKQSINALLKNGNAKYYLLEVFKHFKVIGLSGEARRLYDAFYCQQRMKAWSWPTMPLNLHIILWRG